ncbi:hypothetical protein BT93_C1356 [Corymbia citriodora subsp. variegata]|nr:hypothetical protein BT93_C1356 [Corymbia citriodora subsp. variegata]
MVEVLISCSSLIILVQSFLGQPCSVGSIQHIFPMVYLEWSFVQERIFRVGLYGWGDHIDQLHCQHDMRSHPLLLLNFGITRFSLACYIIFNYYVVYPSHEIPSCRD